MITDASQKKAMRNIATFLVEYIMNDKGFSRDEAVEFLIKTTVYEALMDEGTELYLESREAVLDILKVNWQVTHIGCWKYDGLFRNADYRIKK